MSTVLLGVSSRMSDATIEYVPSIDFSLDGQKQGKGRQPHIRKKGTHETVRKKQTCRVIEHSDG
jgi:hypothetical protein